MQKPLLLLALTLLAACQRGPNALPTASGYDELALAQGHWEWEQTQVGFSNAQTPTTEGHTRQLVFLAGGQVLIGHQGRVVQTTDYQLSMGMLAGCGANQPNSPIITFDNESGLRAGPRKAYLLDTHNGGTRLSLEGDYACVDGGAYESFHWVAE